MPGNIRQDVEDLEAVRRHFGIERVNLIGHSYMGLIVVLHAMTFPASVNRAVQIGAMGPVAGKRYPPHLAHAGGLLPEIAAKLQQMQKERQPGDDVEFCRKLCSVLAAIYVVNPADAGKADWGRCHLPNELTFLKYWTGTLMPSILSLDLTAEEVKKATNPVLAIHGRKDRNAAYGGARDWALMLPDARLVTIEEAAHAPWIEAPETVFGSIETFFGGAWPETAEKLS